MKLNKIYRFLAVGFLFVILSGCSQQLRGQFSEMFRIRKELVRKYNQRDVSIHISNNTDMTVSFINSSFNKLPDEQKQDKAREIALFCVSLLKEDSPVENLTVSFTINKKKFLIVDYTNTLDTYNFKVSELKKDIMRSSI